MEHIEQNLSERGYEARMHMRTASEVTGRPQKSHRALTEYFEYAKSGVDVVEDGLKEMCFGEYLVERGAIDRYQLLRALQMQDRHPGVFLGECVAALGYLPYFEVEEHLARFSSVETIDLD